jgi:transposase
MRKYFLFLFCDMALTKDERVELILLCGCQGLTQRQVADEFNKVHPEHALITHLAVCKLLQQFKETSSVADKPRTGGHRSATNGEKSADILTKIALSPRKSTRWMAAEANVSQTSVRRSKLRPYCMEILHVLHEDDPNRRVEFCEWARNMADEDPTFPERILFSNEAMFHLKGTCNKQTYRWWATTNPHWMSGIREQGSPKFMV